LQERSARCLGKIHKNWRLGGNKLEGRIFGNVDSLDFVLIRSIEGNDGTAPVSITFIARAIDSKQHAALSALIAKRLKQSMTLLGEGEQTFRQVEKLCSAPPAPAESAAPTPTRTPAPIPDVPAMPEVAEKQSRRPCTIREKVRSPHILEQMLKMSSDLSAPAQLRFMDTVEQLASQLRTVLLKTGRIVRIEKNHRALWERVQGTQMGYVDGGMANLAMLGAAPVAVRVGGYVVIMVPIASNLPR
jgi:hypothetical protein